MTNILKGCQTSWKKSIALWCLSLNSNCVVLDNCHTTCIYWHSGSAEPKKKKKISSMLSSVHKTYTKENERISVEEVHGHGAETNRLSASPPLDSAGTEWLTHRDQRTGSLKKTTTGQLPSLVQVYSSSYDLPWLLSSPGQHLFRIKKLHPAVNHREIGVEAQSIFHSDL